MLLMTVCSVNRVEEAGVDGNDVMLCTLVRVTVDDEDAVCVLTRELFDGIDALASVESSKTLEATSEAEDKPGELLCSTGLGVNLIGFRRCSSFAM